jgi:mannonate dehydratase
MSLEQTWRWFGPSDPISLAEIRQTGATGIVTALHHVPTGEIWPLEEILKRKNMIEAEGLRWSVAESLPVHEDIKRRSGKYRELIENYKGSIRNLGSSGIKIICYNFMPVLDWSRTDLEVVFKDGSITTKFETKVFTAFDLYVLKRPRAEDGLTERQVKEARLYYESLDGAAKERLIKTVLLGFPGSDESYTVDELGLAIKRYSEIDGSVLRDNLSHFLREIIPTAEEAGVLMAIHPDDPPWPLLGLPRAVSTKDQLTAIIRAVDSPSNGITLCAGSLGASKENDVVDMAHSFAERINFVHLRNVTRFDNGDFIEDNHLDGDVDLYGVMKELLLEQKRRSEEGRTDLRIPMRPDHGHLMLADRDRKNVYPGYSLFGRMRGLAELRGMELGIERSLT